MPLIVEKIQNEKKLKQTLFLKHYVTGSSMRNICGKLFEKMERPLLTIFQEMRPEVKVTVTRNKTSHSATSKYQIRDSYLKQ